MYEKHDSLYEFMRKMFDAHAGYINACFDKYSVEKNEVKRKKVMQEAKKHYDTMRVLLKHYTDFYVILGRTEEIDRTYIERIGRFKMRLKALKAKQARVKKRWEE